MFLLILPSIISFSSYSASLADRLPLCAYFNTCLKRTGASWRSLFIIIRLAFLEPFRLALTVSTGIRRNDFVQIEINRIDFDESKLIFWEEKKDRPWIVALCPELSQTLKMYIGTLPKDQRFLFEFSGRTAYNIVQKLLLKARIHKHIPFHALRRTCIRLSKKMGRDIRFVMDQTGDTTRVIIEEYEGYTVDEMAEMLQEDNILRRARVSMESGREGLSALWQKPKIVEMSGQKVNLDDFNVFGN